MLAWRRSSLSFFVAGLLIARFAILDSTPVVVVVCVAAAATALWLGATSLRRGRWSAPSQREPDFEFLLRDGSLPALLATVAGGLCLVVLALSLQF